MIKEATHGAGVLEALYELHHQTSGLMVALLPVVEKSTRIFYEQLLSRVALHLIDPKLSNISPEGEFLFLDKEVLTSGEHSGAGFWHESWTEDWEEDWDSPDDNKNLKLDHVSGTSAFALNPGGITNMHKDALKFSSFSMQPMVPCSVLNEIEINSDTKEESPPCEDESHKLSDTSGAEKSSSNVPTKPLRYVYKERIVQNGKKLFVKNINFWTKQHDLWNFFSSFGPVEYCNLLRHGSRKSKGLAFVNFESKETADRVMEATSEEMTLDDRVLVVERAVWRKYRNVEDDDLDEKDPGEEDIGCSDMTTKDQFQDDTSHISCLPEHVMLTLFLYLTLPEKITAERVCKRWYWLSRKSWKTISFLHFTNMFRRFNALSDVLLKTCLQRTSQQSLKSLDVSASPRMLTNRSISTIAKYCPNIVNLNLSGMSITNKGLRTLSEKCTKIQSVYLANCHDIGEKGLWWLFHRCKELKYINLEGNKRLIGQCFHVLCWNVQVLNLRGCSKLQDLGLQKIAQRSTSLKTINLEACYAITDNGLEQFTKLCQTLEVVYLCQLYADVTSNGLVYLGRLHNLKELYLKDNLEVSDAVLMAIGQGCEQIRVLDISGCHRGITGSGLEYLLPCTDLQRLYISYLHQVNDQGLDAIAKNGSLQLLVARGCSGIGDMAVMSLAAHCTSLEVVDVSGCNMVTHVSVQALIDAQKGKCRPVELIIGGTSVQVESLETRPEVLLNVEDLSVFHMRPDRDLALYMGDSDEDEFDELHPDYNCRPEGGGLSMQEAQSFLDGDDPLLDEVWDLG